MEIFFLKYVIFSYLGNLESAYGFSDYRIPRVGSFACSWNTFLEPTKRKPPPPALICFSSLLRLLLFPSLLFYFFLYCFSLLCSPSLSRFCYFASLPLSSLLLLFSSSSTCPSEPHLSFSLQDDRGAGERVGLLFFSAVFSFLTAFAYMPGIFMQRLVVSHICGSDDVIPTVHSCYCYSLFLFLLFFFFFLLLKYYRERAERMYRASPYAISRALFDIPTLTVTDSLTETSTH